MRTVHRNEKYEGNDISIPEINSLFDELEIVKNEVKRITNEILTIQKNCNHDYYFSCNGMYDDSYECIHCKKIEWF
jgi:hypothetical protein